MRLLKASSASARCRRCSTNPGMPASPRARNRHGSSSGKRNAWIACVAAASLEAFATSGRVRIISRHPCMHVRAAKNILWDATLHLMHRRGLRGGALRDAASAAACHILISLL